MWFWSHYRHSTSLPFFCFLVLCKAILYEYYGDNSCEPVFHPQNFANQSAVFFGPPLDNVTCTAIGYEPKFLQPLQNVTVTVGRDASFTCVVSHLGGYRVAWIKADTKAILAIHNKVLTHNSRLRVIHSDHKTWELKINNVQRNDSGEYMCQVNTNPMKSQVGALNVVIPPEFLEDETSGDTKVPEGSAIRLTCKAEGFPEPTVKWRREDNQDIIFRHSRKPKEKASVWVGQELYLEKINREDMGAYLCIASNNVPPSISKRIVVDVHFQPLVRIPHQLVGIPIGSNVTLQCEIEASPKSINYWTQIKEEGPVIVDSHKYMNEEQFVNQYTVHMNLTIVNVKSEDFTYYVCTAKNSLGEVEGKIKLYEIKPPRTTTLTPPETSSPFQELDQRRASSHKDKKRGDSDTAQKRSKTAAPSPSGALDNQVVFHSDSNPFEDLFGGSLSMALCPRGQAGFAVIVLLVMNFVA